MSNGEVKYSLLMDASQLATGVNQALELFGKVNGYASSIAAVITSEWRKLADLNDLSGALRTTVADLYGVQRGMEAAAGSSASLRSAVAFLRRALTGTDDEGGQISGIFAGMGLDPENLRGKSPTEQILTVLEAMRELDDESQQFAARRLFGGAAQDMIMAASQLDKFKRGMLEAEELGTNINEAAQQADDLLTSWNFFHDAVKQTALDFASELLPPMMEAVDLLDSTRNPAFGKAFAQELRAMQAGAVEAISTVLVPAQDRYNKTIWDTWGSAYSRGYDQMNEEMAAADGRPGEKNTPRPEGTRHINRAEVKGLADGVRDLLGAISTPFKFADEWKRNNDGSIAGGGNGNQEGNAYTRIGADFLGTGSGAHAGIQATADATKATAVHSKKMADTMERMTRSFDRTMQDIEKLLTNQ